MTPRNLKPRLRALLFVGALALGSAAGGGGATAAAGAQGKGPVTREELLQFAQQLSKRPGLKEELIREVRRRGINFRLEAGLRSFVATRSGNDADLRRTLEEAERRFLNPVDRTLPPEAEGLALIERARAATLAAADAMPDFVVRQLITRARAHGTTKNWQPQDRLTVAVSFRVRGGEQYKMLAINGVPAGTGEPREREDYAEAGGTSSTGEFVTVLALLFAPETKADFKLVDTDTLGGRHTLVYEYVVKQPNSRQRLSFGKGREFEQSVVVGSRGRLWVDREKGRVLRIENIATEIPADFPITSATRVIDYDWVTINEQPYLLPSRAVLEMTTVYAGRAQQSRNDIRFRNYQKYGTELKIIEEDVFDEEEAPAPKPAPAAPKP